MSTQETRLREIADAIRAKEGSTEPIPANAFASRILALEMNRLPEGTHTINLQASDPEGGTVVGGGVASDGMTVMVNAEAADGYEFKGWQEDGEIVSYITKHPIVVRQDRALIGLFECTKVSRLPKGYKEVEYIESDGNQYINTEITLLETDFILLADVEQTDWVSSVAQYFFGANNNGNYPYFSLTSHPGSQYVDPGIAVRINSSFISLSSDVSFRRFLVEINFASGYYRMNDNPIISFNKPSSYEVKCPLYIFALDGNNIASNGIAAKLYSFKMYKKNSDYIEHDFIPCVSDELGVGVFDLISNRFIGNSGTGGFIPGPFI